MSREIVEEAQRDAGDGGVFWNEFGSRRTMKEQKSIALDTDKTFIKVMKWVNFYIYDETVIFIDL